MVEVELILTRSTDESICDCETRTVDQPAKGIDRGRAESRSAGGRAGAARRTRFRVRAVRGVEAWSEDRRQVLARDGSWKRRDSTTRRLKALDCLAIGHLKAHQNDLRLSLDAWNAVELTQDVLTEIDDDCAADDAGRIVGWDATFRSTNREASDDRPARVVVASAILARRRRRASGSSRSGRMRKGGIGQVWVARDGELQRDVALKEIQPRFAERCRTSGRGSCWRPRSPATSSTPGSCRSTAWAEMPRAARTTRCGSSAGESLAAAIRQFHQTAGRRRDGDGAIAAAIVGHRVPAVARAVPRRLRRHRLRPQPRGAAPRPEAGQHHARAVTARRWSWTGGWPR